MSEPTKGTKERIKEVASLRVQGWTWRQVAKKYQYKNENTATVQLTQIHKDLWRKEYEAARVHRLDEVESAALKSQFYLMDHARSEYVRQMAAHSILAHTAKLRGQKIELTGKDGAPLGTDSKQWESERAVWLEILDKHPEVKKAMVAKLNGRLGTTKRLTEGD